MYIPIIQLVQAAYMQPSPFLTSMNVIVWRLQAVPMNFLCIWMFKNFNYRYVLTLSMLCQVIGGWVRSYAVVTGTFWPILAGTTILSCSMTITWSSQMFIINKWFPKNEYGLA